MVLTRSLEVVADTTYDERTRSTAFTPISFPFSFYHSIILPTNCVTHISTFPLSPDGRMNENVYANPDVLISSSSPIVLLWFSSSPTVLNVDDDLRKWMSRVLSWCIVILRGHDGRMPAVREYVLDSLVQVLVPIGTIINPYPLVKKRENALTR